MNKDNVVKGRIFTIYATVSDLKSISKKDRVFNIDKNEQKFNITIKGRVFTR
ncbi:hypothetical protein [Brachyspira sp.]|uniref:hypothetical protein n=1 Tax=Brachyspira sp. TaxID=1977261 RepID=UPI003D7DB4E2